MSHGGAQDALQAIDGLGSEPLLEGLDGDAQGRGQVVERRVRIAEPSEDQALDEAGSCDFAFAFDESGVTSGVVGGVGQEGLQDGGQSVYADSHEGLLWGVCWV